MFQFDSLAARALLDALYTNDLDIYPDDFARLIRGSAPTTAQVAAALEGTLGDLANYQAILTNELRDINGWWERKGTQHRAEIDRFEATATRAAGELVNATLAAMRQHRAILIGQYQADYEGRHPEYSVNWPGMMDGVPQLGERDDQPNPFLSK